MDFLHAIFDLDGTLLDSMPVWETLGERYLQAHGKKALPGMRADTALLSMRQTTICTTCPPNPMCQNISLI